MTLPTKCPICNNQAVWMCWTGPLGIEEEHIDCPDCGIIMSLFMATI